MGIYFIYQGKVKVTISGANDKEQIVRLAKEGHILGHRGYGGESYPIGAEALEDSSICFVTNELLYDTFITNPEFTYHLMMFYSRELRKSEQRIKYLAQMNVREKVAFALIYLVDTFGLNQTEKTLNIALSRNEIGSIIGINADQVSREISKLKKDNVLNTKGKKIIINNFDQLQEIIADFPYYS
jgi:CRP-like cAMP-binding protein